MTESRDIAVDFAYNVRHLGGYQTPHGRPTSDRLIRAGSLAKVTEAGIATLRDTGVRTIIDFRSGAEREKAPSPDMAWAGIAIVAAPVFEEEANPAGQASGYTGHAELYRMFLDSGRSAYRTLIEAVADGEGGVLFHCAAGKDRTGVAAALLLDLAGVDDETIIADYTLTETLLTPMIDQWMPEMRSRGIDEGRARMLLGAPREAIEAAIVHLRETHGTAEGYARDLGVSETTISALRAKLTA